MTSTLVRVFLLIGLLLSLSAGCSPGTTSPGRVSPTDSTRFTSVTEANASTATMVVPEKRSTPTPTKSSAVVTKTVEEALETHMSATESLTITIVYDNNAYDGRLKTAWGFAALLAYHDQTLLFDTGGDGQTLVENMRILEIDPTQIESVLLSHAHGDHTGGLSTLLELGARPSVYLPPSFSASFKNQVGRRTEVIEVTPGLSITEGMFTTGEMGRSIPEQALIIQTDQGLVVITGCAHPGIVEIVEQAREMFDRPVRLVLGGFHLGGKSKAEIDAILTDFRRLQVEQVAPCHCTGDQAIAMFAAEYGQDFIQAGVGKTIVLSEGEN
jgi:7,8-dihydropterin-6-yl-methyl-4-(beta-D-ribofuranosyl)aminobenzene 5'-phosphate synthase